MEISDSSSLPVFILVLNLHSLHVETLECCETLCLLWLMRTGGEREEEMQMLPGNPLRISTPPSTKKRKQLEVMEVERVSHVSQPTAIYFFIIFAKPWSDEQEEPQNPPAAAKSKRVYLKMSRVWILLLFFVAFSLLEEKKKAQLGRYDVTDFIISNLMFLFELKLV